MKNLLLTLCFTVIVYSSLYSQNTLFDNSRVSSVYIMIPVDSLDIIMTNVLSDYYYHALFIYDYGAGRDTVQNIGFRLRGNTSRFSKKKSFKISFNEYAAGRKYQGVKKINLNGQHNDPTLIREKLFYDTWEKAGMVERKTSFVKLYINQVYYGLYTNLEEFDKEWLQRVYNEYSGNLYKCTSPADLVYHGPTQQVYKNIQSGSVTGGRAYDLQTNETNDNYSDLVDLITILNLPADTAFARLISNKIDIDSFLKAFAIDVATGNWDDYMYNKNNFYLYHRAYDDKFEFVAYDTDNTFGVDWVNKDWATRNCFNWFNTNEPRPLASKILAIPGFMAKYQRYLDTITNQIIKPELIFPHIDSLRNLITTAALADSYRTLDYGYTADNFFGGYTQTIDSHTPYGLKPFLEKRYSTLLDQLAPNSVPGKSEATSELRLFPNPAHDNLYLYFSEASHIRECRIIDMKGKVVKSFRISKFTGQMVLPLEGMSQGTYVVVIDDLENRVTRLFIIN